MTSTSSGIAADLRAGFAGEILTPDDGDSYDAARTVFNAMFDRRPALVARATTSADVAAAQTFGEEKYRRLVALKDEYDPGNLFRMNQNVRPSA